MGQFSGQGAASGAATGATVGSAFGPIGTAVGLVGGAVLGGFLGGGGEEDAIRNSIQESRRAIDRGFDKAQPFFEEASRVFDPLVGRRPVETRFFRREAALDPSVLRPFQDRVIDDTTRGVQSRLAAAGARRSGRAGILAGLDAINRTRERLVETNRDSAREARGRLAQAQLSNFSSELGVLDRKAGGIREIGQLQLDRAQALARIQGQNVGFATDAARRQSEARGRLVGETIGAIGGIADRFASGGAGTSGATGGTGATFAPASSGPGTDRFTLFGPRTVAGRAVTPAGTVGGGV